MSSSHHLAKRLQRFSEPTVWAEFTPLAHSVRAVNLGQGYPGWNPEEFVTDALQKAVVSGHNQYCRSMGHGDLVAQLAQAYSASLGRQVDKDSQIVVTNGATEALFAAVLGLVDPGDEVIVVQPAFDLYWAQVETAGGVAVPVSLRVDAKSGEWVLDMDELAAAFSDKTRVLMLNTPHNPTGKMFSRDELEQIATLVRQHERCVVISDEVYEHITFGKKHVSMGSVLWDQTIVVSSAGKTFSVTGWKIGWTIGPAHLVKAVAVAHQWSAFSVSTPAQVAIARSLEAAAKPYKGHKTFYDWLRAEYTRKRTMLLETLRKVGLTPIECDGTFFVMADISSMADKVPDKYFYPDYRQEEAKDDDATKNNVPRSPADYAFARWLACERGVACIPPSAFYCDTDKASNVKYARFAFCKTDEELAEAHQRLLAHSSNNTAK